MTKAIGFAMREHGTICDMKEAVKLTGIQQITSYAISVVHSRLAKGHIPITNALNTHTLLKYILVRAVRVTSSNVMRGFYITVSPSS